MAEAGLTALALLLAAAGFLALGLRASRTLLRIALAAAEITTASGLADVSARRGDLTEMEERRSAVRRARRARRSHALWLLFWAAWLVAPPLLGRAVTGYALAAPLWLLPAAGVPRRT